MKWYKHVAKSIDNPFVRQLMYEFGSDAYLVFFGTLEIYADNFSPENGWKLTVNLRYFHEKFLLSKSKVKKILEKIYEWEVVFNGDDVTIFVPKFKELLDNYTNNEKVNSNKKLASNEQETFQPIRIKNKEERINSIFVIPTVEEISEYCNSRNNGIDPRRFFDFYEAKGWLIGKNKVKDWKACVRTWEKNSNEVKEPWEK